MTDARRFYKMTGSGNDFVFFDARDGSVEQFELPNAVQRLCARGTGIGADGVVVLDRTATGSDRISIRYYNADGSRASLCGNATLCAASLATQLGVAQASGFVIETDSGPLSARVRGGIPEFDLPAVVDVDGEFEPIPTGPREQRLGYATVGVPHVVIQVPELDKCDVVGRGRAIREDPVLPVGANVNFVARTESGWAMRTYERGVEGETLACGTGSVATALLLREWGEATDDVELRTRSGQILTIRAEQASGAWQASLRGEGRLVFTGELGSW